MFTLAPTASLEGISLRRIKDSDLPVLGSVYASSREEELAVAPWTEAEKENFLQGQFEAQHKYYQENYRDSDFLIVLRNEIPVGRLYLARWETEIRIVDIALLPEGRNQGVGSALLEGILREGEEVGKRVTIHVERNNPALRLYDRLGFRVIQDKGVYLFLEWSAT